ncbi:patatin family protein [Moritella sp. Urea-trap-13]|uniref:patatin-like phospholipase family protein n=1 Tax=Moritella sp. Urea-trap-13 TaxID=2058327 RepID=UPI000C34586D|nr:patatin family protein [Moritella sp. Urea-trap-13]PKH06813.1 patatin family protein [Moritella sp. Urea-trap-13]
MTSHQLLNSRIIERQVSNEILTQIDQTKKKKLALVVQGGGQKGIFTAGVFDYFLEAGFDPFELYIGTSAGALNLSSFISRQSKFGYNFIVNYTTDDEFFNLYKYLRKQKPLNLDWALDAVSAKGLTPLDIITARKNLQYRQAFACATRKDTMQDIYLPLYQDNWKEVLRASCAVPLLYNKKINFNDLEWVDGGVSAAIPVQEAWKRGAEVIVVVRTEPVESVDNGGRVLYDWREKIESRLPQYIEKLSLEQSLDKFKTLHEDLTQRFDLWKVNWSDKAAFNQSKDEKNTIILSGISELVKNDNGSWRLFNADNLERFLSLSSKGKSSEVIEMLARYYQSYRELNDFLVNPPEGLTVIQIAPKKVLRSRALLSDKDDLEIDYREGKEVARHFVKNFADILNEKTTLR